jgi:hypothetical protein
MLALAGSLENFFVAVWATLGCFGHVGTTVRGLPLILIR